MEERHEIIEFPQDLQMKVFIHKIGNVARHWHRSFELLFVLEGQAHVRMDENPFVLSVGDVILINSNSVHELYSSDGAVLIALQFKPELFRFTESAPENLEFNCNSSTGYEPGAYDNIRWAIARMVVNNINKRPGVDYLNYSICYFLMAELVTHFRCERDSLYHNRFKHAKRLTEILTYIELHYAENFNLSDVADSLQLSEQYLSVYFSKHLGVKFKQYYTDVKLNHALQDLTGTYHSMDRIAVDNGFREVHAFIRCFKNKFGVTPNAYRKAFFEQKSFPDIEHGLNYLAAEPSNFLHDLLKYLPDGQSMPALSGTPAGFTTKVSVPAVNVKAIQRHLTHNFKNIMAVGRARDLLNHDVRKELREIQTTIGYKYIKFHGILSDDMEVCHRLPDGTLQFRYQMVDLALEFLLAIGLKPIMQLSFMPTALASDPNKTIF